MQNILQSGKVALGCNYWASNAGIYMWRHFDLDAIEKDFKLLSENGLTLLRIFPLWNDFQPIRQMSAVFNTFREIRMKDDQPLEGSPLAEAGIDEVMMKRFRQVLDLADKIVEEIKSGAIRRFIVMAGCDGRQPVRRYFTETARNLPPDTVILTAGCAKYRYNKLDLGDINGIPRVLDAGQCNDCYSLAVIALKLQEALGLDDVNKLPLSLDIAWYEQKAIAVLLALLYLGFKNIRLGPTLPAFLPPALAALLAGESGIKCTTDPANDIQNMLAGK